MSLRMAYRRVLWIGTSRLFTKFRRSPVCGTQRLPGIVCCQANMAHIRQPRPDSGLGFQVKALEPFEWFPLRLDAEG